MGHYLTSDEIRTRFVVPLAELSGDFAALCKQWEKAYAAGQIARPDLLLNDVLPEAAIARLRKLFRETAGKLEDAVAGVYRYRNVEAKRTRRQAAKSEVRPAIPAAQVSRSGCCWPNRAWRSPRPGENRSISATLPGGIGRRIIAAQVEPASSSDRALYWRT